MWFRNRRKQGNLKARGGVVAAPRRSPKFGPRVVEALEDRALMSHGTVPISHHQTRFMQTNLVSDLPGVAQQTDPQLVNAWGLAASSDSPWWVSDNGSGLSTLYTADGTKVPINPTGPVTKGAVIIPSPTSPTGGTPTGIVSNNTSDFLVNGKPAAFIFDTEDGTIAAWNGGQSAVIRPLAATTRPRARSTRAWRWRATATGTSFMPRTSTTGPSTCSTVPSIR